MGGSCEEEGRPRLRAAEGGEAEGGEQRDGKELGLRCQPRAAEEQATTAGQHGKLRQAGEERGGTAHRERRSKGHVVCRNLLSGSLSAGEEHRRG